jgi:transcriptional regulator with XRE-family HTH domain
MATVATRIRDRRLELGLTLRELASPGVSASYLSRIEKGERMPSGKALRKLAEKLDVSTYWLETGQEDPADELARIVLEHRGTPLPPRAQTLARAVLKR